ncbi:TPA: AAA family ATPase [Photobacterium damselae]
MKLIYLYVENYKVLNRCELKLSSQFNVTRHGLNFEVCKSKIHNGFFSDDLDIVALFGENGAGKSTALDLITRVLSGSIPEFSEIVAIYEENNCIYYYSNIESNYLVSALNIMVYPIFEEDLLHEKQKVLYFSHQVEPLSKKKVYQMREGFRYIDCSNQARLSRLKEKKFNNIQTKACFEMLKEYSLNHYGVNEVPMVGASHPIEQVSKYLKKISTYVFDDELINRIDLGELGYDYDIDPILVTDSLSRIFNKIKYNKDLVSNLQPSLLDIKSLFNNKVYFLLAREKIASSKRYIDLIVMLDHLILFSKYIFEYKSDGDNKPGAKNKIYHIQYKTLCLYLEFLAGQVKLLDKNDLYDVLKYKFGDDIPSYFYDRDDENDYEMFHLSSFIESTLHNDDEGSFYIDSYENFEYLNDFLNRGFDIFKGFELRWNGISSGQYSMLTMLSRLFLECKKSDSLTIFIDEGESNLHPEWQRIYIKELVRFFSIIKNHEQSIHVVLTSHSPFVLSDLPKESINILGSKIEDVNFFGANIFDIYNRGFLLERTVGQFSFEKIYEAIRMLKEGHSTTESTDIINMISDDMIKRLIKENQ